MSTAIASSSARAVTGAPQTTVYASLHAWASWVRQLPPSGRTHLLVDAAVGAAPIVRHVRQVLDDHGITVNQHVVDRPASLDEVRQESAAIGDDAVIAVGGGRVIDRAKLLRFPLGTGHPETRQWSGEGCSGAPYLELPRAVP